MQRSPYHPDKELDFVDEVIDLDMHPECLTQLEQLDFYYNSLSQKMIQTEGDHSHLLLLSLAWQNDSTTWSIMRNCTASIRSRLTPWIMADFKLLAMMGNLMDRDNLIRYRRQTGYLKHFENSDPNGQPDNSVFAILKGCMDMWNSDQNVDLKRLYLCIKHVVGLINPRDVNLDQAAPDGRDSPVRTQLGQWLVDVLGGTEVSSGGEEQQTWASCVEVLDTRLLECSMAGQGVSNGSGMQRVLQVMGCFQL